MDWKEFNKLIGDIEHIYATNKAKLPKADKHYLKVVNCWLDGLPYCSYDNWCTLNDAILNHIQTIHLRLVEDKGVGGDGLL